METFRFLLFGFAGLTLIFWVAVIALWHTYMFPTFFNEDKAFKSVITEENSLTSEPILGNFPPHNSHIQPDHSEFHKRTGQSNSY